MSKKAAISRDSGFQPLPPPPEPPSKLYEDDDFDLYADIETPNPSKLVPPPEPPAMLFALDGDEKEEDGGAVSDEEVGLVIDDRNEAYDPDMPTSPPSPTPSESAAEVEKKQKKKKRKSAIPAPIYPALEDIPPPPSPPPSGCPNQGLYSKMSQEIAKGNCSDDDDVLHLSLPRPPTPPFGTLDLSRKSGKFDSEAQEQTVAEDLSTQKSLSCDEDVDGVPLDDIALPENDPENVADIDGEADPIGAAATNNNVDSDAEPTSGPLTPADTIPSKPKSPEESNGCSTELKRQELSEGELEEDDDLEDKIHDAEKSEQSPKEDESPKKSPNPDAVLIKSTGKAKTDADKVQELLDVLNGIDELEKPVENGKSSSGISKGSSDEREDLLELEERDGLVDITDEEISNYEKSWEMEENGKKVGLEGLETEAISDNEYPPGESDATDDQRLNTTEKSERNKVASKCVPVENGRSGEEGEIITEERRPVQWKKLSKTTKERSYRGDKEMSKKEANKEITKKKEKRKELERYDVRKLISEKPRRKVDEFGRDISSHSRSNSRSVSRGKRSASREKKKRSRTRSRSKERARSKQRNKERSRSKSRSREKRRERSREKSKERRSTSRSRKKRRSRSPKKDRARSREKISKEERSKKRKKSVSMSCSSCSCSSCEREKRRSKKLTVIVTNEEVGKRKEKKKKDKKSSPKSRKRSSPVPSKEVFTSGDNILVSVNFKSSKSGESRKESKRRKDDESKKKKDKGTKENQPVRSIVTAKKSKKKLNTKNIKPVAIIDLDASPFREVVSPKEVIILTDSDSEDKRPQQETQVPVSITGPKTPPEPLIKFNIVNNKQQSLRTMSNPLMDALLEQLEEEVDDVEANEIPYKGPNTPPEPPVPYDPFEPTKSRSPTPVEAQMDRSSPTEAQQAEQVPQTSPKLPQHVAPKTPSPLHSPPKPAEEPADKPKLHPFQPAGDSGDDSPGGGGGGGDSPYSPGSSEGDDLFEPPMPQPGPLLKGKSRIPPLPANVKQHFPKTSSKKRSKGHKDKKGSKKEIGIKLDEDQLKILDELPNSAVEMQVKDKFLKKLNRQERVVEEVKMVLKPHYAKKHVTKEEYKEILRKAVPKICHSKSGEINPAKIQRLIEAYVKKYRHKSKKKGGSSGIPPLRQNKAQVPWAPKIKTLWC